MARVKAAALALLAAVLLLGSAAQAADPYQQSKLKLKAQLAKTFSVNKTAVAALNASSLAASWANPVSQAQGAVSAAALELRSKKAPAGVQNATSQPPAQILCYYDTRSGVVTGLSVDGTQVCLVGDGVVPVRLSPTQVIVDVGVAPVKNARLVGRLTFWVADTANQTAAPVPVHCGRVPARHLNMVAPAVSTRPRNSLVPNADVKVYPQELAAEAARLANPAYLSGAVSDKIAAETAKVQADAALLLAKEEAKKGNATALAAAEAAKKAAKENAHGKKKNDTSFAASVLVGGGKEDWTVASNLPAQLGVAQAKKQEIDAALLNAAVVTANEAEALAEFVKGNGGKRRLSSVGGGSLPSSSAADLSPVQGAALRESSPGLAVSASLAKVIPGHFLSTFQLLNACSAGAVAPPPWLSVERDSILIDGEPVSSVVLKDLTRPPLAAPLDPLGLAPEFTAKTCKATIYCVPGDFISTADAGCQPTAPDTKFLFVVNDALSPTGKVSTSVLRCPAAGAPPLAPELIEVPVTDSSACAAVPAGSAGVCHPVAPAEPTVVSPAQCIVGGATSSCVSSASSCASGLVPVPDQTGTCNAVCCGVPPPPPSPPGPPPPPGPPGPPGPPAPVQSFCSSAPPPTTGVCANGLISAASTTTCTPLASGVCNTATCCKANQVPMVLDDYYTTSAGQTMTVPVASGVRANDIDPDFTPGGMTVALVLGPFVSRGSDLGVLTVNPDGSFTYVVPAGLLPGDTVTFIYSATDAAGGTAEALATITIVDPTALVIATTNDFYVLPSTFPTLNGTTVISNDPYASQSLGRRRSRRARSLLTVTNVVVITPPTYGIVVADGSTPAPSVANDGTFQYTRLPGAWPGKDTFEYRADGFVNGVAVSSRNTLVTIIGDTPADVPPPSSAPTAILPPTAYDDNYNTVGNTPVSMDVCINDTPGTGGTQPFTVTLVTTPEAGGTLSAAGCTMTYTPNAATTPPYVDHFRYTVTDETGTSPAALVTIRIDAAPFEQSSRPDGGDTPTGNGGPVATVDAVNDNYVMIKGSANTLTVPAATGLLANDRLPVGATVGNLVISVALSVVSGPANIGAASLVLTGTTGAFVFTPDGSDSSQTPSVYQATYTLTGSPGSTGTDTATVTFTLQALQSAPIVVAPIAADDSYTFQAGTAGPVVFSPSILANDASRNAGGVLSVATGTVSAISPAGKGSVLVNNVTGVVTFTPGTGGNAPISGDVLTFTYRAADSTAGAGNSNQATVSISVVAAPGGIINVSPLLSANNDYYAIDTRVNPTTVTAPVGVKANDVAGTGVTMGAASLVNPWTAPTGTVCSPICKLSSGTYTSVSASVVFNADGSFAFTQPSGNNAATYVFKYQIVGTDAGSAAVPPATAIVQMDALQVTNNANAVSGEDDVYYVVAGQTYSAQPVSPWLNNDALRSSNSLPSGGLQVLSYTALSPSSSVVSSFTRNLAGGGGTSAVTGTYAFTIAPTAAVGSTAILFSYTPGKNLVLGTAANVIVKVVAAPGSSTQSSGAYAFAVDDSYAAILGTSLVVGAADSVVKNDLPNPVVSPATLVATLDPNNIGVAITGPNAPSTPVSPASSIFTNFNGATSGGFTFVPSGSDTAGGWTYTVPYLITYTPSGGTPVTTASAMIRVKTGLPPATVPKPVAIDDTYSVTKGFTFSTPASTGVLANDQLPPSSPGPLAVVPNSVTPVGTVYGTVTVAADGGVSFVPSPSLPSGTITAIFSYRVVDTSSGAEGAAPANIKFILMDVPAPQALPEGTYGSATCPSPSVNLASCSVTGTNPFTSCVITTGTRKGQGGVCFGGCCMTDGTCKSSSCVAAGLGNKLKECNGPQCADPGSGDRLECRVYVDNCVSSKDRKCIGVTTCGTTPTNLNACRTTIQDPTLRSYIGRTCLDSGNQGANANQFLDQNWKVCDVGCSLEASAPYQF